MGVSSRSSDPVGFLIAIAVFVIVMIISYFEIKKEEKRRNDIHDYCLRNKIKYSEKAKAVPEIVHSCLLLKEKGSSENEWIIEMSGVRGDYTFCLFDYYYVSGSGKNRTEGTDTICVVQKENLRMPQFFVRSERLLFDSVGKLLGNQDINFEEDHKFSCRFILRGKDEIAVREFFDSRVREAFLNGYSKEYKYEGIGNCFVVSVAGKLNLEERLKLLANTMNVFRNMIPPETDEYLS